jgi:rhodanese-related sulfurtransferase
MSRKHARSKKHSFEPVIQPQHKTRKRIWAWLWIGLGGLLIAIVGIVLLGSRTAPTNAISPTQTTASVEISPADAFARFQQGVFFLDVRSQAEWDQFHLQGSTLIPLDELPDRLAELSKDAEIVVVCRSGHRSQSGSALLQQAGFTHVYSLKGGLQAWLEADYPIIGTP